LTFVQWAVEEVGVDAADRLSNHAPFHFDLSVFDVFAAAAAGASMIAVPEDVAKFPASLADLISTEAITVWYSVPFALIQLMTKGGLAARDLGALRSVLYAGEPFPAKHLRHLMELLPHVSFHNLYGPTETNVCTFHRVPPLAAGSEEPIPIGRACANTELLVVDASGEEVPAGEPGELLVRSPSTMAGYWGRPELTAEAFARRSTDPPLERSFYRTGDMVRSDADGTLHFLGRRDRQVKLRGFRIELDEIEGALLLHEDVEEAAVYLVRGDDGDAAAIEAAVVATPGSSVKTESLIKHLARLLPSYAVPARVTTAEAFPRTSTGKLDRRSLEPGPIAAGSGGER
jgi:amino acid adenylation domain-containing protein